MLATFHETFPYVLVFRVQGAAKGKDLILIGSAGRCVWITWTNE